MSANEKQVGGAHYKTKFEHWDFVATVLRGRYLEGCITKYVTRWHKKNGVQDLEKALHYVAKLRELFAAGVVTPLFCGVRFDAQCREFVLANKHPADDYANNLLDVVVKATAHWQEDSSLVVVAEEIAKLLKYAEAAALAVAKHAACEAAEGANVFDYDRPMSVGRSTNEELRSEFRQALARNDTKYASKILDLMDRESIDITGRVGSRRVALANRFMLDQLEFEGSGLRSKPYYPDEAGWCGNVDERQGTPAEAGSGYTNQG